MLAAMAQPGSRLRFALLVLAPFWASCVATPYAQAASAREEQVTALLDALQRDLDAEGPAAWADYLADGPSLLVTLPSGPAIAGPSVAARRAEELRTEGRHVAQRLEGIRIELLDPLHVVVEADYVEVLRDEGQGERTRTSRVVGVLVETDLGWRFERLHFMD